ncbi:MAG: hypothetical protein IKM97_04950 [Clostridia bacterium]|nr:hypothetical protein [Clostridia bacterium]
MQSELDQANASIIHLKIVKEETEELLENSVSKDKIREFAKEVENWQAINESARQGNLYYAKKLKELL